MHPDPNVLLPPSGVLHATASTVFSGIESTILLGGETAPMTVMAMRVSTGQGAPAHISFSEDKVFQVSGGALLFLIGDDRIKASVGDHFFVARGVVHGFVALGNAPALMTLVSTPARHDRFFMAMGQLPSPHEPEAVEDICRHFDQSIVGPVISAGDGAAVRV